MPPLTWPRSAGGWPTGSPTACSMWLTTGKGSTSSRSLPPPEAWGYGPTARSCACRLWHGPWRGRQVRSKPGQATRSGSTPCSTKAWPGPGGGGLLPGGQGRGAEPPDERSRSPKLLASAQSNMPTSRKTAPPTTSSVSTRCSSSRATPPPTCSMPSLGWRGFHQGGH